MGPIGDVFSMRHFAKTQAFKEVNMHPLVCRLILVPSLLGLILAAGCGGGSHGDGFVDTRPWAEEPFTFDEAIGTHRPVDFFRLNIKPLFYVFC